MARARTKPKQDSRTDADRASHEPSLQRRILPLLLLCGLAAVAYLNADHEEFLFDSSLHRAGDLTMWTMKDPAVMIRAICRHPLRPGQEVSCLSVALNHAFNTSVGLDGFEVTTFLVFNVMIHAINACLVYLLIRALLRCLQPNGPGSIWIPLAPAMLFAVHPIHASSVAYIIQRRGTLAAMFYLITVLIYLHVRQGRSTPNRVTAGPAPAGARGLWPWWRVLEAGLIPIGYWLSYKSKQIGLTLPLAILAIEFCLQVRQGRSFKRILRWLVPGCLLMMVCLFGYAWWRGLFDPAHLQVLPWGPKMLWGPWTHFLTESRAFVHYWKLLLLPLPAWSTIDHDFALSRHLLDHLAVVAVTFHGLLLLLALGAAFKRYTLAAIGVFWFYIPLIPYVILPQYELLVEYKTYLPSVGLMLILAEGLSRLRSRVSIKVQVPVVVGLTGLLLATTIHRNVIYQNAFNFWSDAIRKSPNHRRPYIGLGLALARRGQFDQAIIYYQKALQLKPRFPELPREFFVEAVYDWGIALYDKGDIPGAIEQLTRAVTLKVDFALGHNALGNALLKANQTEQARHQYALAVHYKPDYADAHYNLANVLRQTGLVDDAIRHYKRAIEIEPNHGPAHKNLASVLWLRRDWAGAVDHYRQALRCRPEWWDVASSLALIYATSPDPAVHNPTEAVRWARQACRLSRQREPGALVALAIALDRAGQPEAARRAAHQAVQLARTRGSPQFVEKIRRQLAEYLNDPGDAP